MFIVLHWYQREKDHFSTYRQTYCFLHTLLLPILGRYTTAGLGIRPTRTQNYFPCKGFLAKALCVLEAKLLNQQGKKKKKDAYPILFLQWILFRASGNLEKDGATDRTMREEEKNILGKDLSLLTLYTCPFRSKIASDSLYNQQYASILRLF